MKPAPDRWGRGGRRARPERASPRARPRPWAALVLALALAACADTVRPVLGGLKVGTAGKSFRMPTLENERLPFGYPAEAWERGIGGETVLRIHISARGTVDSARVVHSSGHRSLDSAAVAGALRLRYRPARHGEEPVAVWGILPVRYPMPAEAEANR